MHIRVFRGEGSNIVRWRIAVLIVRRRTGSPHDTGTRVTGIADAITIGVDLDRVRYHGAVVDVRAVAVLVPIVRRVERKWIAHITQTILISVLLAGISRSRTIVDHAANAVTVRIGVGWIVRTWIAAIAQAVVICVDLRAVRHVKTVVDRSADAVIVRIVGRILRADIARIDEPVAVAVRTCTASPNGEAQ